MSVRAPTPAGQDEIVSLCAFLVGAESYVLDLRRIRQVLKPLRVTPVPRGPAHLEGVIQLRGEVIPVIDLRKRLGAPAPPPGPLARLLITWVGRRQIALIVDRVTGVLRLPRSQLTAAPQLWGVENRFFLGVCGQGEDLKLLLNIKALLSSDLPVEPIDRGLLLPESAPPRSSKEGA